MTEPAIVRIVAVLDTRSEPVLIEAQADGYWRYGARCADCAWVGVLPGCEFDAERRGCYVRGWREVRYHAIAAGRALPARYAAMVAELERQLERVARKLPAA